MASHPTFAERASPARERWAPRFWLGSTFGGLLRVFVRNRFRVAPGLAHIALIDLLFAAANSFWSLLERLRFGRQIDATRITDDPIFVIGHWRSGTTLLHELLALDPRHAYPTTYQCFSSSNFLVTERAAPYLTFLKPDQRPMDAIPVEWDSPLEDEFALCNLGVPSPYETIAFPNQGPRNAAYLDLTTLSEQARARWRHALDRFLRKIALRNPGKRIVLKSPTHTCRIDTLLAMYPRARFVHIVREPEAVFASTMHLWRAMYAKQGFQRPTFENLEEDVLSTYEHMEARLRATRPLVPSSQWHEVRYEDLIADPVAHLERIYAALGLGALEPARARIAKYLEARRSFPKGRHALDAAQRASVRARWAPLAARYGYGAELDTAAA